MKNYILTTEHPVSHYGMPILVDEETWRPIGTSDLMPEFNPYNNKSHLLGGYQHPTGASYAAVMVKKLGLENVIKYLKSSPDAAHYIDMAIRIFNAPPQNFEANNVKQ